MSKYVKKPIEKQPIVIEAVRFMLEDTLPDWFMDKVTDYTITTYASGACDIKTLRGTVRADFGDYIIMDKNGEVYPCKPEIFNKTYRKIEEGGDIKFEIDYSVILIYLQSLFCHYLRITLQLLKYMY